MRWWVLGWAGAFVACADGPPPFCEGSISYRYDPLRSDELSTFPDDLFTRDDAATATGLRPSIASAPWTTNLPAGFEDLFRDLETLDGWGTNSAIFLGFSGPLGALPSGAATSVQDRRLQLFELTDRGSKRIPYEVRRTDDDTTILVWPMVPLKPKTRHALVLTTEAKTPAGNCVAPPEALRQLLTGTATAPALQRVQGRYQELLEKSGIRPEDVSAAVVFTTQSIEEESVAIAGDIAGRSYTWAATPTCATASEPYRVCNGAFEAKDYRRDGAIAGSQPAGAYQLPVRVWLPKAGAGPWPVVLFGHGLSGDRDQASALAKVAAPLGIATVAIDALAHGEHPTSQGGSALLSVLSFFGIDSAGTLHARVLRDNWRQSTYDKLQLLKLLTAAPDVTGDGTADLDVSKLAYYGVSLGGIMGSELLSLTDGIGAAILSVPGGRVASIISEASQFALVIEAMKPPGTTDGDVDRFFPVLQTLIERGDASNYGPRVLANRLPIAKERTPHLLFNMVVDDDTVPNVCNHSLARALGVPHVPEVRREVSVIPLTPAAPVAGNLAGGVTAGLFQFDRITRSEGEAPRPATHGNVSSSREGMHQAVHFLQTWLAGGAPEIVDPYVVLGTP